MWAGFGAARSPRSAQVAFYFDDKTQGSEPPPAGLRMFNGACTDISKSHVASVFAEVFGYPLHLDPTRCVGPIVEKADKNGVHDGQVVIAPLQPRKDYVYQRLVDTADKAGLVHDLRTPCVGGAPVVVWEKTKPAERRFAIHNSRAVLRDPASVYSPEELALIGRFTARMGLDWGGLDVLRDRDDGRLYIVDVNKTDLGPVIALSWADKLRSMHRLSVALSQLVEPPSTNPSSQSGRTVPVEGAGESHRATKGVTAGLGPMLILVGLGLIWILAHPQNTALAVLAQRAHVLHAQAELHPILGLILFVLSYAAAVSLMLPVALILTFAGGFLLGPVGGAVGAIVGATLGATISYGVGRLTPPRALRNWERRAPLLRKIRNAFASHPFRFTLSMRLMPLTPFTLVSLAAGAAQVGARPFLLGTALGVAPECIAYSLIGGGMSHAFVQSEGMFDHPILWIGLFAAGAFVLVTTHLQRTGQRGSGKGRSI